MHFYFSDCNKYQPILQKRALRFHFLFTILHCCVTLFRLPLQTSRKPLHYMFMALKHQIVAWVIQKQQMWVTSSSLKTRKTINFRPKYIRHIRIRYTFPEKKTFKFQNTGPNLYNLTILSTNTYFVGDMNIEIGEIECGSHARHNFASLNRACRTKKEKPI